jgi:TolA-binding protein
VDQINPETGLYKIGLYYLKSKKYTQALYAFGRYLVYYPSGKYSDDVTKYIYTAEDYLQKYGQGKGPVVNLDDAPQKVDKPEKSKELSVIGKGYYNGVNLMGEGKYEEASEVFKKLIQEHTDEEYALKAQFEVGKCLYYMNNYDHCVKMFTALLQKYPKHPDMNEALFFIAQSYHKRGHTDRAVGIYRKVLSLTPEADSLYKRALKALRELERK